MRLISFPCLSLLSSLSFFVFLSRRNSKIKKGERRERKYWTASGRVSATRPLSLLCISRLLLSLPILKYVFHLAELKKKGLAYFKDKDVMRPSKGEGRAFEV